jgi:hypothetical protein
MKLRIDGMKAYNNRRFMTTIASTTKLPAQRKAKEKRKPPLSIPLNAEEDERLVKLIAVYQEAIVDHNRKHGQHHTANVTPCDIVRAGMIELEKLTPEDLRLAILSVKNER